FFRVIDRPGLGVNGGRHTGVASRQILQFRWTDGGVHIALSARQATNRELLPLKYPPKHNGARFGKLCLGRERSFLFAFGLTKRLESTKAASSLLPVKLSSISATPLKISRTGELTYWGTLHGKFTRS